MSFPGATFNLTLLGPSLPHLQGNIKDLTSPSNPHQFPSQSPIDLSKTTQILRATEKTHLETILSPIESRNTGSLSTLSSSTRNFIKGFHSSRWRNSNLSKRSHQSKTASHQPDEINTVGTETTFERVSTTPSTPTLQSSSPNIIETDQTPPDLSKKAHASLMDTRSPEHADLFESNKIQGPIAVRRALPSSTPRTDTSSTTALPQVVTPKMAIPSPSPEAFRQLPVSTLKCIRICMGPFFMIWPQTNLSSSFRISCNCCYKRYTRERLIRPKAVTGVF